MIEYFKQHHLVGRYVGADLNPEKVKYAGISADPVQALKEIKRVAKSSAYFIISVPNEPFFRWGNLLRGKYWNRGGRTPGHWNFFLFKG